MQIHIRTLARAQAHKLPTDHGGVKGGDWSPALIASPQRVSGLNTKPAGKYLEEILMS